MTPDATPPELLRAAHCSPTRECSQCNATHGNLGGLTEKHGKDWFTLAYCPACKAKTWTKAYRWENDQAQAAEGLPAAPCSHSER